MGLKEEIDEYITEHREVLFTLGTSLGISNKDMGVKRPHPSMIAIFKRCKKRSITLYRYFELVETNMYQKRLQEGREFTSELPLIFTNLEKEGLVTFGDIQSEKYYEEFLKHMKELMIQSTSSRAQLAEHFGIRVGPALTHKLNAKSGWSLNTVLKICAFTGVSLCEVFWAVEQKKEVSKSYWEKRLRGEVE